MYLRYRHLVSVTSDGVGCERSLYAAASFDEASHLSINTTHNSVYITEVNVNPIHNKKLGDDRYILSLVSKHHGNERHD